MKNIIYALIVMITLISCKDTKKVEQLETENKEQVEQAQNLKSIEVAIEGMTCEIGCARLIQSKLSKIDGVTYTNVDFESKKGVITFDLNKLSANDISTNIDKIAGGDLYSVTNTTELTEIITKSKKTTEISK